MALHAEEFIRRGGPDRRDPDKAAGMSRRQCRSSWRRRPDYALIRSHSPVRGELLLLY